MSQTKIRSRRTVVWGWIVYSQRLVRLALKYLNNPFLPSIFRENLMTEQARGVSVKDHHGGHFLTQKQIEPSMSALKAQLTAEFNARVKQQVAMNEHLRNLRAPFTDLVGKDPRTIAAVSGLRGLAEAGRHDSETWKPAHVNRPKQIERVFGNPVGGPIAVTRVPPYDYQDTWSASSEVPSGISAISSQMAHAATGDMKFRLQTGNAFGAFSCWSGVGIYFHPTATNGTLRTSAAPALNYFWGDWCFDDRVTIQGWIRLNVNSYDMAGGFTGTVYGPEFQLWYDSSWFGPGAAGANSGSTSGYGLQSTPIQVDGDHHYAIWVVIGGNCSGGGFGLPPPAIINWFSFASQNVAAHVPSIQYEFG
jgi:hypothetical protein